MEDNTKIKVLVLRQGWIASTLSDIQTFGFMVAGFAVNSLYLGNNGWLNACLFITFFVWIFAKASLKTLSKVTDDVDEAIAFCEEQRGKKK